MNRQTHNTRVPNSQCLSAELDQFGPTHPNAGCVEASLKSLLSGLALLLVLTLCGCASPKLGKAPRTFDFSKDTFAFANELTWEYGYDTNGVWTTKRREPPPDYSLHCFVVARSVCQFFENARFDPLLPRADEDTYRRLVHRVIKTSPRKPLPSNQMVIIPGYPDLRSFSKEHETLLKKECGSAWQSYVQRGNWRMIFPFTRHQQLGVADHITSRLRDGHPVLVHLVRFPQLTINHTVLLLDVEAREHSLEFKVYDPNEPSAPTKLTFENQTNTFLFPPNAYFRGGRVEVYEICHRWDY